MISTALFWAPLSDEERLVYDDLMEMRHSKHAPPKARLSVRFFNGRENNFPIKTEGHAISFLNEHRGDIELLEVFDIDSGERLWKWERY